MTMRTGSVCVETADGQKFVANFTRIGVAPKVSENLARARELLLNGALRGAERALDTGERLPWVKGYSFSSVGLVTPEGAEIPWPQLRFSIVQAQCAIYGPDGRVGRARLPVGGKNGVIVMQVAKMRGAELEFPRSTFAANKAPTRVA
jgi:hypothetical protein